MEKTLECKNIQCKHMLAKRIWGTKLRVMYFQNQYTFWGVGFNANFKEVSYGFLKMTEKIICPQMTDMTGKGNGKVTDTIRTS